jgi:hypothetical protein
MIFSVTKAGGTRHCHECNAVISKGGKFLLYQPPSGMYKSYENYCPRCAIKKLNYWIKAFQGMKEELNKYISWDE